jgi:hypothetical protein
MPMSALKRTVLLGAAAAALAAGACNESTAPASVDPTAMASAVTSLDASMSQNQVFQSLTALDGTGPLGAVVARAITPLAAVGATQGAWASAALRTRVRMEGIATAPSAVLALFFSNVLGKTFQWDTASPGGYRITDSTLAGGPSNGVRFLLYQTDTATGQPSLPLYQIGYLDLADVSTTSVNAVRLLLKVGSLTAADYTVTEDKTTSSLTLSAVGYVTNAVVSGSPIVNFNLSHTLTLTDSSLATDYQANDGSATVSLVSTVSGSGGTPSLTLDWTATKGGSVEIVGFSGDTIHMAFKINGSTIATVTGTPANPSLTTPSGQPLSLTEGQALVAILDGFDSIYYNLSLVFLPGLLVFG